VVVHVGRVVIRLGLAGLVHQRGFLVGVVHVERQRLLVVEELGVHRPLAVLVEQSRADELALVVGDEIVERQQVATVGVDDEAQPLELAGERAVIGAHGR
jgi:hypothetical protein